MQNVPHDETLVSGRVDDALGAIAEPMDRQVPATFLRSAAQAMSLLPGGPGNDIYFVTNSSDSIVEAVGGGIDTVYASVDYTLPAGQEIEALRANAGLTGLVLTGNEFANALVSGKGIDTLAGLGGNDRYYVNFALDKVNEAVGGGGDTIYTSVSYTLQAGQEIEVLFANGGSKALTLTGNEFANALVSGLGIDTLAGLGGNDTYYVNDAGDKVVEAAGGGSDTVKASTSYALQAGQEIELLKANAGSVGLNLTGNEFANALVSGLGLDTLAGLGGNDTYYINDAADKVVEALGGGNDAVKASTSYALQSGQEIETLQASAGLVGLSLTGNEIANTLISGRGIDTLAGHGGNDSYYVNDAADKVVEAAGGGNDTVRASTSYALQAGQEVEFLLANVASGAVTLTGNSSPIHSPGVQDGIRLSALVVTTHTM